MLRVKSRLRFIHVDFDQDPTLISNISANHKNDFDPTPSNKKERAFENVSNCQVSQCNTKSIFRKYVPISKTFFVSG